MFKKILFQPVFIVCFLSLLIAASLSTSLIDIRYIPTDSFFAYLPAARSLPGLVYVSEIHQVTPFAVNTAKDVLIFGIALMQYLLNDYSSLYPNVYFLIIMWLFSTWLVFSVVSSWFGRRVGLLAFFVFVTSYWPYVYILLGSHQLAVLTLFLATVKILQLRGLIVLRFFMAGVGVGLMGFSSPTAFFYMPYLFGVLCYEMLEVRKVRMETFNGLRLVALMMGGIILVWGAMTWPDPWAGLMRYVDFLTTSQQTDHLSDQQYRGGWLWVVRYFTFYQTTLLVMYLLSVVILLRKSEKFYRSLICILISFSPLIVIELLGVAQFARNYFVVLIGMIWLISFAYWTWLTHVAPNANRMFRRSMQYVFLIIIIGHSFINSWIFFYDLYPSRMMTAHLYTWLIEHNMKDVNINLSAPYAKRIMFMNVGPVDPKIRFHAIKSLQEFPKRPTIVAPLTNHSVWNNCREANGAEEFNWVELTHLEQTSLKRFKSMTSSRYWPLEEEHCAWLEILGKENLDYEHRKGFVWVLPNRL